MFDPSHSATEPRLLDSVAFPTNRFELLKRAETLHAPDALFVAIKELPDATFHTRQQLIEAVEAITST